MEQTATVFVMGGAKSSEVARNEQEALSTLQWAISRAADAILIKDNIERRRVLIASAHGGYDKALQFMIQSPTTSVQVQRNLAHLEALLGRLGTEGWQQPGGHQAAVEATNSQCAICLQSELKLTHRREAVGYSIKNTNRPSNDVEETLNLSGSA